MSYFKFRSGLCAAFVVGASLALAAAQASASVSATSFVSTTGPSASITDSTLIPGNPASAFLLGSLTNGASASTTASYGTLSAYDYAYGKSGAGPENLQGFAKSTASFSDYLYVGGTLAAGTDVTLTITKDLSGSISGAWGYVNLLVNGKSGYQLTARLDGTTSTVGSLDPYIINTKVGDTVLLTGSLEVQAWAYDTAYRAVTADFSHTANFYADSIPGVTLTSTSGHNYSSPAAIPEPETYAMLLAGVGLLGFTGRRRKQKEVAAA